MLKIKGTELYHRLLFSIIAIGLIALLLIFAYRNSIQILLTIIVTTLTAIGVWEYTQLFKSKAINPATTLMIIVAMVEVLAFHLLLSYPNWSKTGFLIIISGFISFFIAHLQNAKNALLHIAVEFFGICYLAIPFSFILAILYPKLETFDGRWWIVYLIGVTKIADVAGYFIGKLFGKYPLAPKVSPKKTVEGSIAGFLSCIALSLIFAATSGSLHLNLSYYNAVWLGALIGVLAQLGDLSESILKRDASVKDSNILPGIGGVLDTVDSILFTAPIVYLFSRSL
jgi:phosphatidate cytidylyltransferase